MNYLRNNELLYPDDKITRRQLLTEAKFYQIQGIVDQLEEEMFPSSVILKDKVDKLSWLPHGAIWSLLYRASDDGKRPADFHRQCDNKGPTVVLIKLGEFILGGYTSKSWQGGIYVWLILTLDVVLLPCLCLYRVVRECYLNTVSFKEYAEVCSKYLCSWVTCMLKNNVVVTK